MRLYIFEQHESRTYFTCNELRRTFTRKTMWSQEMSKLCQEASVDHWRRRVTMTHNLMSAWLTLCKLWLGECQYYFLRWYNTWYMTLSLDRLSNSAVYCLLLQRTCHPWASCTECCHHFSVTSHRFILLLFNILRKVCCRTRARIQVMDLRA